MSIFQVALSLFLVLNPLGNIPLFVGLLSKYPIKKQKSIIIREMIFVLFIVILFSLFGKQMLSSLGISHSIMGIAGGVLLFIISLEMIFPKEQNVNKPSSEPFIVPLATPIIAGPGTITSTMVYSEQLQDPLMMVSAVCLAWLPTAIILYCSANIKSVLGEKGMVACERLGGMLIALIATKMIVTGVLNTWQG